MFRKLYLVTLALLLASLTILGVLSAQSTRERVIADVTSRLQTEIEMLKPIVRANSGAALQELVAEMGRSTKSRVTVVGPDGSVLADSQASPAGMDNHNVREEVRRAREEGRGVHTRYSATVHDEMLYYAALLAPDRRDGIVLRTALPLSRVDEELASLYQGIAVAFVITAVAGAILGYLLTRRITEPLREIRTMAQAIAGGDFSKKTAALATGEIAEVVEAINRMSDELSRRMAEERRYDAMRREFVANVSHELRTPLSLVQGYVETLKDGAWQDPQRAPEFLDVIDKNVRRLAAIVEDLLQLSRLESAGQIVKPAVIVALPFLEKIRDRFKPLAARKRQEISVQAEEPASFRADPDLLERAIGNLVDNAIKYTQEGGRIRAGVTGGPDGVEIAVEDNGPGIPEKDLPRIFERFYRVDKSRSRELGGTGLGLAIVKHIVQLHGGRIDVASEVGKGTRFRILLPTSGSS